MARQILTQGEAFSINAQGGHTDLQHMRRSIE